MNATQTEEAKTMKSTVIEKLIADAKAQDGARVLRYGRPANAALGVSLPGHHRHNESGINSSALVRVEWLASAGHDDDPGCVAGNYLRPFGDSHRVVSREFGIDNVEDLPDDLIAALKRARIAA
jgi:hypothetical protein